MLNALQRSIQQIFALMIFAFFHLFHHLLTALFDIAARVMTWMGARWWSKWKIISVDCMAKIIFERLNSRWIGWLRSVEKWQEKHSTISENAFIWVQLFLWGALRRIQLLSSNDGTVVRRVFIISSTKKKNVLEKNKRFQCKQAPGPRGHETAPWGGPNGKLWREFRAIIVTKKQELKNRQHFNEIRDLFHVAHFYFFHQTTIVIPLTIFKKKS